MEIPDRCQSTTNIINEIICLRLSFQTWHTVLNNCFRIFQWEAELFNNFKACHVFDWIRIKWNLAFLKYHARCILWTQAILKCNYKRMFYPIQIRNHQTKTKMGQIKTTYRKIANSGRGHYWFLEVLEAIFT